MIDPAPGGDALNLDKAKDQASTTGLVGSALINVSTIGNADFADGVATITPTTELGLTSVTFTPADGDLFGSFSFRGQLEEDGNITVTVQDNQGGAPEVFVFGSFNANANIDRIGIIAVEGSGETIKSVTVSANFRQQKQIEFGLAEGTPTPSVPDGGATLALLGLGLAGLTSIKRKL